MESGCLGLNLGVFGMFLVGLGNWEVLPAPLPRVAAELAAAG